MEEQLQEQIKKTDLRKIVRTDDGKTTLRKISDRTSEWDQTMAKVKEYESSVTRLAQPEQVAKTVEIQNWDLEGVVKGSKEYYEVLKITTQGLRKKLTDSDIMLETSAKELGLKAKWYKFTKNEKKLEDLALEKLSKYDAAQNFAEIMAMARMVVKQQEQFTYDLMKVEGIMIKEVENANEKMISADEQYRNWTKEVDRLERELRTTEEKFANATSQEEQIKYSTEKEALLKELRGDEGAEEQKLLFEIEAEKAKEALQPLENYLNDVRRVKTSVKSLRWQLIQNLEHVDGVYQTTPEVLKIAMGIKAAVDTDDVIKEVFQKSVTLVAQAADSITKAEVQARQKKLFGKDYLAALVKFAKESNDFYDAKTKELEQEYNLPADTGVDATAPPSA